MMAVQYDRAVGALGGAGRKLQGFVIFDGGKCHSCLKNAHPDHRRRWACAEYVWCARRIAWWPEMKGGELFRPPFFLPSGRARALGRYILLISNIFNIRYISQYIGNMRPGY